MNQDLKALLSGGYCFSIRDSGPFIIGEDFETPGSVTRLVPRIKIDSPKRDELWSFVERVAQPKADDDADEAIFEDATKRSDFENGVDQALNWHVSDFKFQVNIPGFRKELQKLRKTIEQFKSQLPQESEPLGHFLCQTYTGEIMLPDRLKPSERTLTALQKTWQDRVGVTAIKETLETMLRNIEAAQLLIGNKKPRQHQAATFVQLLQPYGMKQLAIGPRADVHLTAGINLVRSQISSAQRTTSSQSPFGFPRLTARSGPRVSA
jgi:hypothetical protein